MKVAGFSIARNVIKYDYPVKEAILSVLPACDAFYVAVGKSDDDTLNYIRSIDSPKIKVIETVWDDTMREGGLVLSMETNKAFNAIPADYDWAFYIQGDEVLHEKYLPEVKAQMEKWKDDKKVEGLLFDYLHFYGTYDYIADSRKWYRNEIRIIRNDKKVRSYKDAQGFRTLDNEKLRVKKINACIYHYGWVKSPKAQMEKQKTFHKMWHDDAWVEKNVGLADEFDYSKIDSLAKFGETHPQVMQQRIAKQNWQFHFDKSKIKLSVKEKFLKSVEKGTGWRVGEYKNFRIIE
jgi:hypothetical protein